MPKNKFPRITFYFLLFFLFIITSIQLQFTFLLNDRIKDNLLEEITKQTNGEYSIQIDKFSVDLFTRSIRLSGFLLTSQKEKKTESPELFISAQQINLLEFKLMPLFFRKHLIIGKIELNNASGYLYRRNFDQTGISKSDINNLSFYRMFSKYINSLEVINTDIADIDIRIFSSRNKMKPLLVSRNNRLKISNLKVNSFLDQTGKLFLADSLTMEINNINYKPEHSLYQLKIKKLTASYTESKISLDSIGLSPVLDKKDFQIKVGHQTDRFNISATHMIFNSTKVNTFFESNRFISSSLNIVKLKVLAYRDKNIKRSAVHPKSVQQLIGEIPLSLAIDSINLKNAAVIYEEVPEGSDQASQITFNDLQASILGFSNTIESSRSTYLTIEASSKLMNTGRLQVHYFFPLNTRKMRFDCSGKLVDFPFTAISPVLENNENIQIKKGTVDSLFFSFHANEYSSKGWMKFVYHDLKIEFIKKNKKEGIIQDLISALTHTFIIKENNPSGKKPVRMTEISYLRDPTRFFLNYSWKSLLSGIKPTIGIKNLKGKEDSKHKSKK